MCFCVSQDGGMEASGTRFLTRFADGYYQLLGTTGSFVSYRVSDQAAGQSSPFSNAGENCTPNNDLKACVLRKGWHTTMCSEGYLQCHRAVSVACPWQCMQQEPGICYPRRDCSNLLTPSVECRHLLHKPPCGVHWSLCKADCQRTAQP